MFPDFFFCVIGYPAKRKMFDIGKWIKYNKNCFTEEIKEKEVKRMNIKCSELCRSAAKKFLCGGGYKR